MSQAPSTPATSGGATTSRARGFTVVLAVVLVVVVVLGWKATWFLTDDSYIAFRYVSNLEAGRGLVWNPAPFLPVDGYTSFSWVIVLWAVWEVLGVEPPEAANVVGLLFGLATLAMGWRILARMALPEALVPHRRWLIAIVLLGVAGNRVFLTWLSGGLGTSMFVFALTWWVAAAVAPKDQRGARRVASLAGAAALAALTRPDGLLAVGATGALVLLEGGSRRRWFGLWPLLLVVVYFAWHRSYYGELLPNTYYAKHVSAWPEAGWRYLASYSFENGVWAWLLLAAAWLVAAVRWLRLDLRRDLGAFAAVGVIAVHAAYYAFVIGGDHFEYRVLAQLPLLMAIAAAWMAARIWRRPAAVLAAVAAVSAAALPIAWLQWRHRQPLAPHVPAIVRPVAAVFDGWQQWLHEHFVCFRQPTLAASLEAFLAHYGPRSEGAKIAWDERPIVVGAAIGALGWVVPNVAVIDALGLTDWVVARTPVVPAPGTGQALLDLFDRLDTDHDGLLDPAEQLAAANGPLHVPGVPAAVLVQKLRADFCFDGGEAIPRRTMQWATIGLNNRRMAHERSPPPGYLEGFRPNVTRVGGRFLVERRAEPLTDAEIIAHEANYRALVTGATAAR